MTKCLRRAKKNSKFLENVNKFDNENGRTDTERERSCDKQTQCTEQKNISDDVKHFLMVRN